jgi:hypothetical protein
MTVSNESKPELYDVEVGLTEAVKFRRRRDAASRAQVTLADRLAGHLLDHFGPEAEETAGIALVVGAASLGALAVEDVQPSVIVNILALAGQRMVSDARAGDAVAAVTDGEESDS